MDELINRCKGGEAQAFESLAAKLTPWALSYARSMAKDGELALDIVQDSMITVLSRIGDLKEPGAIYAWMRQIIRTHLHRTLRRRRELPLEDQHSPASSSPAPSDIFDQAQIRRLVASGLAEIPQAGREAAELFYIKERSIDEVSRQLGVPTGTVKRRLHDARRRLRETASFNLAGAYFGLGDRM